VAAGRGGGDPADGLGRDRAASRHAGAWRGVVLGAADSVMVAAGNVLAFGWRR
jgi:hypothetical protein